MNMIIKPIDKTRSFDDLDNFLNQFGDDDSISKEQSYNF